jgi:hypothetical protein
MRGERLTREDIEKCYRRNYPQKMLPRNHESGERFTKAISSSLLFETIEWLIKQGFLKKEMDSSFYQSNESSVIRYYVKAVFGQMEEP